MNSDHPHYKVHLTHCCVRSCKYGDEDCPVVNGVLPAYRCEDCTCAKMNAQHQQSADKWIASLSATERLELFLRVQQEQI